MKPADARPADKYPAKAARYESLDHWRGVACLAVVVFHATMQVAGPVAAPAGEGFWASLGAALLAVTARFWIGVPMFFVISGYCIMATIDSRRRRGDGLGEYVRRRFWRIYPPYSIALTVSVLIVALFESTASRELFADGIFTVPHLASLSPWQWLGNLTLTETWRAPLADGHGVNFLPNTWTLNYEEQFYLVAGLILLLAPRRIFLAAAVITGLVVVAKVGSHLAGVSLDGTFADGRWLLIADRHHGLLQDQLRHGPPVVRHLRPVALRHARGRQEPAGTARREPQPRDRAVRGLRVRAVDRGGLSLRREAGRHAAVRAAARRSAA